MPSFSPCTRGHHPFHNMPTILPAWGCAVRINNPQSRLNRELTRIQGQRRPLAIGFSLRVAVQYVHSCFVLCVSPSSPLLHALQRSVALLSGMLASFFHTPTFFLFQCQPSVARAIWCAFEAPTTKHEFHPACRSGLRRQIFRALTFSAVLPLDA